MATHRPNCLTPAKQKAAAAADDDSLSKKLKVDEAMEDDLAPDVKSGDDFIPANQTAEETPANQTGDEIPVVELLEFISDDSEGEEVPEVEDIEIPDIYKTDKEKDDYKQYVREYTESDGFDVVTFVRGGIYPLLLDYDDFAVQNCKTAVEDAIKFKNKQNNWNLKLVEITRCNFKMPYLYYVSFNVEDELTREKIAYQAKLQRYSFMNQTVILKFRVRPVPEAQVARP